MGEVAQPRSDVRRVFIQERRVKLSSEHSQVARAAAHQVRDATRWASKSGMWRACRIGSRALADHWRLLSAQPLASAQSMMRDLGDALRIAFDAYVHPCYNGRG